MTPQTNQGPVTKALWLKEFISNSHLFDDTGKRVVADLVEDLEDNEQRILFESLQRYEIDLNRNKLALKNQIHEVFENYRVKINFAHEIPTERKEALTAESYKAEGIMEKILETLD